MKPDVPEVSAEEAFARSTNGEAVIVDVATLAAPGVNAITSLSVIPIPLIVPVIVEFPEVVEEVKVAV